jgi:hypothetical protein
MENVKMILEQRFLLFMWDGYYPEGGFNDFHSEADTIERLEETVRTLHKSYSDEEPLYDYYQIVNAQNLSIESAGLCSQKTKTGQE